MTKVGADVPAIVVAGDRAWAALSVRNIGDRTVWWQAGGGLPPATAVLTAPGARHTLDGEWSGKPNELDQSVPRGFATLPFLTEEFIGLLVVARTSPSEMKPLAPGEQQTLRVASDVRLPPLAADELGVRASATFYNDPADYGGAGSVGPRPTVVAECSVAVTAVPSDNAEPAVEAFARDLRLARFVDSMQVDHVKNSWRVHLAWWRGAWELTVTPTYSDDERGQSRYRLRYADGEVIDARRIWWDQAPADDPDGTRFPAAPPDDVD